MSSKGGITRAMILGEMFGDWFLNIPTVSRLDQGQTILRFT